MMTDLTRRDFLIAGGALAAWATGCVPRREPSPDAAVLHPEEKGVLVNDVHAQLNPTEVDRIVRPDSLARLQAVVQAARAEGKAISIAGGRHAMGGQQFGRGTILVDMRGMSRVLAFDPERGTIDVEAGIEWPELIRYLRGSENGAPRWGIVQKQTGADRLTIGGALAANIHGRGLRMKPMIADVESFVLVGADGAARTCSRTENAELFRLAIGGYGLFGPIANVTLRLAPRRKLERVVKVMDVDGLMPAFEKRIAEGFLFGDFQYATDGTSRDFLRKGVFSCYRPVEDERSVPEEQRELSVEDWRRLLFLSHVDKTQAFNAYAEYYVGTSGQLYWSDTHQESVYIDDYHAWLDERLGMLYRATEMITEIYVPRAALVPFLDDVPEVPAPTPSTSSMAPSVSSSATTRASSPGPANRGPA